VHLDSDVTFAGSATLARVCVGPSIGGGFKVTPEASPRDGALDLLFVDALGPLQALRYVPRVLRGTHAGLPVVRMHRLKSVRLASPTGEPFFFELDGELMDDPVRQLEVEVLPASLNVLRPRRARA
jgi:diacylglycerol kinase (ATP)